MTTSVLGDDEVVRSSDPTLDLDSDDRTRRGGRADVVPGVVVRHLLGCAAKSSLGGQDRVDCSPLDACCVLGVLLHDGRHGPGELVDQPLGQDERRTGDQRRTHRQVAVGVQVGEPTLEPRLQVACAFGGGLRADAQLLPSGLLVDQRGVLSVPEVDLAGQPSLGLGSGARDSRDDARLDLVGVLGQRLVVQIGAGPPCRGSPVAVSSTKSNRLETVRAGECPSAISWFIATRRPGTTPASAGSSRSAPCSSAVPSLSTVMSTTASRSGWPGVISSAGGSPTRRRWSRSKHTRSYRGRTGTVVPIRRSRSRIAGGTWVTS